jgi:hypothetical protein
MVRNGRGIATERSWRMEIGLLNRDTPSVRWHRLVAISISGLFLLKYKALSAHIIMSLCIVNVGQSMTNGEQC